MSKGASFCPLAGYSAHTMTKLFCNHRSQLDIQNCLRIFITSQHFGVNVSVIAIRTYTVQSSPDKYSSYSSQLSWTLQHVQCESKKIPPPLRGPDISHFPHKWLRIFNQFFTHLLYVPIYARLQIFIQLSPTLTKLCHIKHDYAVHIICTKCLKRAKMRAIRRLRKSLIALLIVVCGK